MEGTYPIYHGDEQIGQAQVTRRGLYYYFACRLRLSGEVICRVEVSCGDKRENLGIPVPDGKWFTLTKTVPISRLGSEKPVIRVLPRHPPVQGKFVPLNPDEPFAYLSQLKHAYLQYRDGKPGIVIRE